MLFDQIEAANTFIRSKTNQKPEFGLILGSGLGSLNENFEIETSIDYSEIPNFPISTAPGHEGKLIFAKWFDRKFVIMLGRVHYYEGYSLREVTFPVRVLNSLGIERLIITNACGSVNENIKPGDLVFVDDHINLLPDNPLRGTNDDRLGPRFPDMTYAYDKALNRKALSICKSRNIDAHTGVLVALPGPALETAAEYRYSKFIGADLVGMSVVPEVIVAIHSSLKVFVISVVTDQFTGQTEHEVTSEQVLAVARSAVGKVNSLFENLIQDL